MGPALRTREAIGLSLDKLMYNTVNCVSLDGDTGMQLGED